MALTSSPKPSRVKVGEHRARLRAQGLRPIQIWVPDVRAPSFRSEAHRQSLAVALSAQAQEDQAFIDAVEPGGVDQRRSRLGGEGSGGPPADAENRGFDDPRIDRL